MKSIKRDSDIRYVTFYKKSRGYLRELFTEWSSMRNIIPAYAAIISDLWNVQIQTDTYLLNLQAVARSRKDQRINTFVLFSLPGQLWHPIALFHRSIFLEQ